MVNRWPAHDTFTVALPDRIDFLAVADILLDGIRVTTPQAVIRIDEERLGDTLTIDAADDDGYEVECVKITSFQIAPSEGSANYYGRNHGEGRLTPGSLRALESLLERIGGKLTTRGPHGADTEERAFVATSADAHPLTPFFAAIRELEAVTPLSAACEIAKCAEIEEERQTLMLVLQKFAPADNPA